MSQQIRIWNEAKENLDFLEKRYGESLKGSYNKKILFLQWFHDTYEPMIKEIQNNDSMKYQ